VRTVSFSWPDLAQNCFKARYRVTGKRLLDLNHLCKAVLEFASIRSGSLVKLTDRLVSVASLAILGDFGLVLLRQSRNLALNGMRDVSPYFLGLGQETSGRLVMFLALRLPLIRFRPLGRGLLRLALVSLGVNIRLIAFGFGLGDLGVFRLYGLFVGLCLINLGFRSVSRVFCLGAGFLGLFSLDTRNLPLEGIAGAFWLGINLGSIGNLRLTEVRSATTGAKRSAALIDGRGKGSRALYAISGDTLPLITSATACLISARRSEASGTYSTVCNVSLPRATYSSPCGFPLAL
jgi:hypothetical protein